MPVIQSIKLVDSSPTTLDMVYEPGERRVLLVMAERDHPPLSTRRVLPLAIPQAAVVASFLEGEEAAGHLSLRLGQLVSLSMVRQGDRIVVGFVERGVVGKRYDITLPRDQGLRVARFLREVERGAGA